jgi:exocyst complex component 2
VSIGLWTGSAVRSDWTLVPSARTAAQAKADAVWNPILEARLKADRLRSTLGIFERSKFFFTLPGVLSEAISAGRYDAALSAYKKGKYLLDSRPGALLGLPPGTTMTEQQGEKHRRVFEKVWGQVERTMSDLRTMLGKRLRDPKRSLEEVEKTIECVAPARRLASV